MNISIITHIIILAVIDCNFKVVFGIDKGSIIISGEHSKSINRHRRLLPSSTTTCYDITLNFNDFLINHVYAKMDLLEKGRLSFKELKASVPVPVPSYHNNNIKNHQNHFNNPSPMFMEYDDNLGGPYFHQGLLPSHVSSPRKPHQEENTDGAAGSDLNNYHHKSGKPYGTDNIESTILAGVPPPIPSSRYKDEGDYYSSDLIKNYKPVKRSIITTKVEDEVRKLNRTVPFSERQNVGGKHNHHQRVIKRRAALQFSIPQIMPFDGSSLDLNFLRDVITAPPLQDNLRNSIDFPMGEITFAIRRFPNYGVIIEKPEISHPLQESQINSRYKILINPEIVRFFTWRDMELGKIMYKNTVSLNTPRWKDVFTVDVYRGNQLLLQAVNYIIAISSIDPRSNIMPSMPVSTSKTVVSPFPTITTTIRTSIRTSVPRNNNNNNLNLNNNSAAGTKSLPKEKIKYYRPEDFMKRFRRPSPRPTKIIMGTVQSKESVTPHQRTSTQNPPPSIKTRLQPLIVKQKITDTTNQLGEDGRIISNYKITKNKPQKFERPSNPIGLTLNKGGSFNVILCNLNYSSNKMDSTTNNNNKNNNNNDDRELSRMGKCTLIDQKTLLELFLLLDMSIDSGKLGKHKILELWTRFLREECSKFCAENGCQYIFEKSCNLKFDSLISSPTYSETTVSKYDHGCQLEHHSPASYRTEHGSNLAEATPQNYRIFKERNINSMQQYPLSSSPIHTKFHLACLNRESNLHDLTSKGKFIHDLYDSCRMNRSLETPYTSTIPNTRKLLLITATNHSDEWDTTEAAGITHSYPIDSKFFKLKDSFSTDDAKSTISLRSTDHRAPSITQFVTGVHTTNERDEDFMENGIFGTTGLLQLQPVQNNIDTHSSNNVEGSSRRHKGFNYETSRRGNDDDKGGAAVYKRFIQENKTSKKLFAIIFTFAMVCLALVIAIVVMSFKWFVKPPEIGAGRVRVGGTSLMIHRRPRHHSGDDDLTKVSTSCFELPHYSRGKTRWWATKGTGKHGDTGVNDSTNINHHHVYAHAKRQRHKSGGVSLRDDPNERNYRESGSGKNYDVTADYEEAVSMPEDRLAKDKRKKTAQSAAAAINAAKKKTIASIIKGTSSNNIKNVRLSNTEEHLFDHRHHRSTNGYLPSSSKPLTGSKSINGMNENDALHEERSSRLPLTTRSPVTKNQGRATQRSLTDRSSTNNNINLPPNQGETSEWNRTVYEDNEDDDDVVSSVAAQENGNRGRDQHENSLKKRGGYRDEKRRETYASQEEICFEEKLNEVRKGISCDRNAQHSYNNHRLSANNNNNNTKLQRDDNNKVSTFINDGLLGRGNALDELYDRIKSGDTLSVINFPYQLHGSRSSSNLMDEIAASTRIPSALAADLNFRSLKRRSSPLQQDLSLMTESFRIRQTQATYNKNLKDTTHHDAAYYNDKSSSTRSKRCENDELKPQQFNKNFKHCSEKNHNHGVLGHDNETIYNESIAFKEIDDVQPQLPQNISTSTSLIRRIKQGERLEQNENFATKREGQNVKMAESGIKNSKYLRMPSSQPPHYVMAASSSFPSNNSSSMINPLRPQLSKLRMPTPLASLNATTTISGATSSNYNYYQQQHRFNVKPRLTNPPLNNAPNYSYYGGAKHDDDDDGGGDDEILREEKESAAVVFQNKNVTRITPSPQVYLDMNGTSGTGFEGNYRQQLKIPSGINIHHSRNLDSITDEQDIVLGGYNNKNYTNNDKLIMLRKMAAAARQHQNGNASGLGLNEERFEFPKQHGDRELLGIVSSEALLENMIGQMCNKAAFATQQRLNKNNNGGSCPDRVHLLPPFSCLGPYRENERRIEEALSDNPSVLQSYHRKGAPVRNEILLSGEQGNVLPHHYTLNANTFENEGPENKSIFRTPPGPQWERALEPERSVRSNSMSSSYQWKCSMEKDYHHPISKQSFPTRRHHQGEYEVSRGIVIPPEVPVRSGGSVQNERRFVPILNGTGTAIPPRELDTFGPRSLHNNSYILPLAKPLSQTYVTDSYHNVVVNLKDGNREKTPFGLPNNSSPVTVATVSSYDENKIIQDYEDTLLSIDRKLKVPTTNKFWV